MIVKQFDLKLVRLRHEHLEELREWRNSSKISSRMEYREQINSEMQTLWFNKVDNISSYLYLVLQIKEKNIGIIHIKKFMDDNAEVGMFIWDDEYLHTHIPVLASSIVGYLNFYLMKNTRAFCKMLITNKQAIAYNTRLGYKLCSGQEGNENQLYCLTREDYEKSSENVKSLLQRVYQGWDQTVYLELEEEDKKNGVSAFINGYYESYLDNQSSVKFVLLNLYNEKD